MKIEEVSSGSGGFSLTHGEVAVWRIDMTDVPNLTPTDLDPERGSLSGDELARARAFQLDTVVRGFVRRRQALRGLLGRYLGLPAGSVELAIGAQGKPSLAQRSPALTFNMSITSGAVLIGLTRAGDLGIDVERRVTRGDELAVARSFFVAREHAYLAALPQREVGDAFLRLWTRKEAVMKAAGLGMSLAPDAFEVDPVRARVADLPGNLGPVSRWRLDEVDCGGDLIAALAVRDGGEPRIANFRCVWKDLA